KRSRNMITGRQCAFVVVALSVMIFVSATVEADPLNFTIANPTQVGPAGSTLTFTGSVTNGGTPAVNIAASNFTFKSPNALVLDDTSFIVNFLGQNVIAGATLGPLSIFTVTIGAGVSPGNYSGVFSIVFNSFLGLGQETNLQQFSVTVQPAGTP